MTAERQQAAAGVGMPGDGSAGQANPDLRPAETNAGDLRQQAADALRPFAQAWADLQGAPEQYRRPGYALLAIGGARVTSTHLRLAADALAALDPPKKPG